MRREAVFLRLWRELGLRLQDAIWGGTLCLVCLAAPVLAFDQITGDGSDADNARLLPGNYPAEPVLESGDWLREPYDPFFEVDWSVALRGTFTKSTEGDRYDTRIAPQVSLSHTGNRSLIDFDASAEIVKPQEGEVDVSALRLDLSTGYALDSVTNLGLNAGLSFTQALPGTPGVATDIAVPPETLVGNVDADLSRQFGKFNVSVLGSAERSVYGETTREDGVVEDNTSDNLWSVDAGLRVGFQAIPIFEVFGQAGVGRDLLDQPSPSLQISTNATDTSLRGGVVGRWSTIFEAEASTGISLRRFDEASLGEVTNQLYDARLTYTPDPTLRLTAGFTTTVAPPGPDNGGITRVNYAADAQVAYTVNSWLALRARADWNRARFIGSDDTEEGYGLGLGADYKVNAHTAVTADYGFDHRDSTSDGLQDAHTVGMGITIHR